MMGPHSHSEFATARRCLREYSYRYELRREPLIVAEALTIGKRVDKALKSADAMAELKPKERALVAAHEVRWRTKPIVIEQTDVGFSVILDGVEMVGELDAIGTIDGERVGVEYKTTSEDISPGSTYWKRITRVDPQSSIYLAHLETIGVRKLVFDVLRKSALREKKGETPEQLFDRTIEDISARPDWYFARQPVVRLEDERAAFAADIASTARLIATGERPRNPDACIRFGRECEFLGVCTKEMDIHDDRYFRNREPSRKLALARESAKPADGTHARESVVAVAGANGGGAPQQEDPRLRSAQGRKDEPRGGSAGFGDYRF